MTDVYKLGLREPSVRHDGGEVDDPSDADVEAAAGPAGHPGKIFEAESAEQRDWLQQYSLYERCLERLDEARAGSKAVARALLVFWWNDPALKPAEILDMLNDCWESLLAKAASELCAKLWLGCGLPDRELSTKDLDNARDLIQDRCREVAGAWR